MPSIDPIQPRPANKPPLAQALHSLRNPEPSRLGCHCGHCPLNEELGDIERSVDACLMDALNMVDIMSASPRAQAAGHLLALHSLHGLLTYGRLMCCVQRYAVRPGRKHEA